METDNKKKQDYAKIFLTIIDRDYVKLNNDVQLSKLNPRIHYLNHGRIEGREYSYLIDEKYIKEQKEYKANGAGKPGIEVFFDRGDIAPNSWLDFDYINSRNNNRFTNWVEIIGAIYNNEIIDICPYFDDAYYRCRAEEKGIKITENALLHYLTEGWLQGIDFNPLFDSWYFIEKNGIREIDKPYLLYLFDNRLLEISPFLNIAHINHHYKDEVDHTYNKTYSNFFNHPVSLNKAHEDLKENIISFISRNNHILEGTQPEEIMYSEFLKYMRTSTTQDCDEVEVSIIIVNYHKVLLTMLAAYSALLATRGKKAEIIIVDNESNRFETDILYRYMERFRNVKIIALKDNVYFGEANNIGLEYCRGKYVLFLNNDAFISGGILNVMLEALNDEVIAASPLAINSNNQLVEAGGTITEWNDVYQNLKGRAFDRKLQESLAKIRLKHVDYVSAACLLIRRDFLIRFGGFDPRFEPFYFEDTDLCKRITSNGFKIALLTDCAYLHLENTSTKEFLKGVWNETVSKSRSRFHEKWEAGKHYGEIEIKKSMPHKYRAAIYTPFKINVGGGENYILSVLAALSDSFNMTLILPFRMSKYRIRMIAEQLGVCLPDFDVVDADEAYKSSYDLLITMGNSIFPEKVFNSKIFCYHCQFPFPIYNSCYHSNKSDYNIYKYLCYSDYTRNEIEKELARYKLRPSCIEVISPPVRIASESFEQLMAGKNAEISFVTVGRFFLRGHRKNQDKILDALLRISLGKKIRAYIYGGSGPLEDDKKFFQNLVKANTNPNITIAADVSNAMIQEAYKCSHFYIHAAGLNTALEIRNAESEHFGISLVEAMSYGCVPIVFAHGGPKEILGNSSVGFQYQNLSGLNRILEYVTSMQDFASYYQDAALKSIRLAQTFDIANFNKKIHDLASEAIATLEK